MKSNFFKTRFAAIILIVAGYGWAGGHDLQATPTVAAFAFQLIIIVALLITGLGSVSVSENEKEQVGWSVAGLSIFSALLLLINILNIIHWGHHSNAWFLDSHNSFGKLVPLAFLITGNILWVASIVRSIKHDTKAHVFKSQYNIL